MREPTIGDKVRIINRELSKDYSNQIGVIVSIDDQDDTLPYRVCFQESNLDDWFSADDVELVEEDKFNVGDTVRIKSLEWYEENKNSAGNVHTLCWFTEKMRKLCGEEFKITEKRFVPDTGTIYTLDAPDNWSFTADMFEEPLTNTKSLLMTEIKSTDKNEITLLKRNKLITNVTIV